MGDVALAWFRRDLRLVDNPAWAAATSHASAVPVVVLEPRLLAAAGPHRRRAYLGAVAGLERSLKSIGASLWVAVGDPAEAIAGIVAELGASTVCVNADVTLYAARRDRRVADALGRPLEAHWGTLVQPPGTVLTRQGTLSQVFTPFWRRWQRVPLRPEAQVRARHGIVTDVDAATTLRDALTKLRRIGIDVPSEPSPASAPAWSEASAAARLDEWLEDVDRYHRTRDDFGTARTSELSVALHLGALSPRSIVAAVGTATPGREAFVRQLAWRDWYAHLTHQHPNIANTALKQPYNRIAWRSGNGADRDFEAWKAGRTGYPIVDAAMRQLAATGQLHNRLRMIAASFLVKNLLIDWRRGERWFRRLLVDGDVAQNAGNWQWVAGTGPDAAPYFRIFNPVAQSRRHDPDGIHLRRWTPELARLPADAIHAPWEATPAQLTAADVKLGVDYPTPIVNHTKARQRTLAAYRVALEDGASAETTNSAILPNVETTTEGEFK